MRGVNPEVLCQIQQLGEELELRTTNCSGKPTSQTRTRKSRKQMLHPRPTTRERVCEGLTDVAQPAPFEQTGMEPM